MLHGQHRVSRAQIVGYLNPLPNVEVSGIVGGSARRTYVIIVSSKRVHAEVEGNTKLKLFKFAQRECLVSCGLG